MAEPTRALHVRLKAQTAKKLDEIMRVTEEGPTALIARLIREEYERRGSDILVKSMTAELRPVPAPLIADRALAFAREQR